MSCLLLCSLALLVSIAHGDLIEKRDTLVEKASLVKRACKLTTNNLKQRNNANYYKPGPIGYTLCGTSGTLSYCAPLGSKCCDSRTYAPIGATCCAAGTYARIGEYCCIGGGSCPIGRTCRGCTAGGGSAGTTAQAPPSVPATTEPPVVATTTRPVYDYFTFTIT